MVGEGDVEEGYEDDERGLGFSEDLIDFLEVLLGDETSEVVESGVYRCREISPPEMVMDG